jgi:hypothetical protein
VVEPTYRWVCSYCDTSDVAESSEMVRLAIDVHVSVFHAPARREVIRAQGESAGTTLVESGGQAAQRPKQPRHELPPDDRPPEPPRSGARLARFWWRTVLRRGGRQP